MNTNDLVKICSSYKIKIQFFKNSDNLTFIYVSNGIVSTVHELKNIDNKFSYIEQDYTFVSDTFLSENHEKVNPSFSKYISSKATVPKYENLCSEEKDCIYNPLVTVK